MCLIAGAGTVFVSHMCFRCMHACMHKRPLEADLLDSHIFGSVPLSTPHPLPYRYTLPAMLQPPVLNSLPRCLLLNFPLSSPPHITDSLHAMLLQAPV